MSHLGDMLIERERKSQRTDTEHQIHYHMKTRFSNGYRYETEWFQAHERMRQKRTRGIHALMGPNNMDSFDRHKMCMDVVSWILYWGTEHREFDDSLKWIAEFLKCLLAYTTQEEEDWFDDLCNKIHADTTGRKGSH